MDEYVVSCVEGTAEMGRPMIKKLLEANEKGDPLPGRAQILVTAMAAARASALERASGHGHDRSTGNDRLLVRWGLQHVYDLSPYRRIGG